MSDSSRVELSAPASGTRLAEKVAVVVGAGQSSADGLGPNCIGNGRAISLLFAAQGAHLVLVDRDRSSLAETVSLANLHGGRVTSVIADVTDESSVANMARHAVAEFGRVDVLVNNVGIGTGDGGVTSLDRDTWNNIFAVNATGMFLTCKHVIPVMRTQQSGVIVNISSTAAVSSAPIAAYKASKAAVNALTQHLANANARFGIRVNAVMPGLMDTPMAIGSHSVARGIDPDILREERHSLVPLRRRMGSAWDTAHAALFLASDEAGFITGVLLPVDGGQLARIG